MNEEEDPSVSRLRCTDAALFNLSRTGGEAEDHLSSSNEDWDLLLAHQESDHGSSHASVVSSESSKRGVPAQQAPGKQAPGKRHR